MKHARYLVALMLAALTALIASCGGSGVAPTVTATSATSIQLLVSNTQLPSAGTTPVTLTAIVLNSTGQALPGQTVVFSNGGDTGSYFTGVTSTTDTNGTATATLNLGSNKINRTIAIAATSGTATGSGSVDVSGTTIAISGNSSLALGATTALTISVKDSAGGALSGVAVSVTSQSGNTTSLSSATTNASGQVTANVTATNVAASDVITVSAAGTSKTQALTISSDSFAFTAPTASALIPINTATPISVTWTTAGAPVVGSTVNFSASRGTISGATVTNASGVATASITSSSTGAAIISAAGTGGTPAASVNVTFYTTTASTITPQATPSTIQVTTGTANQTSNASVISVVVRDAANNLVPKALVNFSITADASGGSLSSATATTDAAGSASVTYTAGGASSAQNGVTISTTVTSINGVAITPVTNSVALTVSGQSTLVRLGTDNLVLSNPPVNQKKFVALVTDVAGNAVAGATVQFKLRAQSYTKGYYVAGTAAWGRNPTATCANEDTNFNGIVDVIGGVTEDINGNGALDPGMVASITASAVTDVNGVATATITYPKDHAGWATYVVEARTGTNSNDPPALATFTLMGLASDYTDLTVAPPGQTSPYGTGTLCTNAL